MRKKLYKKSAALTESARCFLLFGKLRRSTYFTKQLFFFFGI